MKLIIKAIILVLIFYSCTNNSSSTKKGSASSLDKKESSNNLQAPLKNDTFIIIINNKNNIDTNIGSGIYLSDYSRLNHDTKKTTDTLIVNVNANRKIYIKNNSSFKYVICSPNDTLNIELKKYTSKISFSNRILNKYDTISLGKIYKTNSEKEYSMLKKLNNKYIFKNRASGKIMANKKLIKKDFIEYRILAVIRDSIIVKNKKTLKNLLSNHQISLPNFNYEKSTLKFNHFMSLIEAFNLTSDKYYVDLIKQKYIEEEAFYKDVFNGFGFMSMYIRYIILNNQFPIDYKKSFNQLPNHLKDESLRYFLEHCLHQMANSNSIPFNDVKQSFEVYKKSYPNSELTELFDEKYLIKVKSNKYNIEDVVFINNKFETLTLKNILKKNKDKLIYMDFWASWCAPCIKEMPSSKKLQSMYKDEDVAFIYISTDSNKSKWLDAQKKIGLKLEQSFLALNYPNATFYNDLKLNSIPRYLLFDKKGELIIQNAPRPSSKEIRKYLNDLLNEKTN